MYGIQKNQKNTLHESASFNVAEQEKKGKKSYFEEFITKLLGRVFLTKKNFFWIGRGKKIAIIVTPSMKIASVVSSPKKWVSRFPQKRQDILNSNTVLDFANENGFDITFIAPTPQLSAKLYTMFGDIMDEKNINESNTKYNYSTLFEELQKSSLPESIKQWAKDNPEKFIKNIESVKNLLK